MSKTLLLAYASKRCHTKWFVFYSLTILSVLSGCATIPTARISGVDRKTVVEALCETGGVRTYYRSSLFGGGTTESRTVWTSSDFSKKTTLVKKYSLSHFLCSTECRDRITVKSEDMGTTLLSLKCEQKFISFIDFIAALSPFYKRNPNREERIMTDTLNRLVDQEGVSYEWVGKWKPTSSPIIAEQGHTKWLAYKGGNASLTFDYFSRNGYEEFNNSDTRRTFTRHLTKDPYKKSKSKVTIDSGGKRRTIDLTSEWESVERILIRIIKQSEDSSISGEIVVVGLTATGVSCQRKPVGGESNLRIEADYTDVSPKLLDTIISGLKQKANKRSRSSRKEYIEFIDPTPWVEALTPPSIDSDLVQRLKTHQERQQEELARQKIEQEKAKKAVEKKKKKSFWNFFFR